MLVLGRPIPEMVQRVAEAVHGRDRVLEVAAGTGLVTAGIAPVVGALVATDYAPAMVEQLGARTRSLRNVSARVLDLYELDTTDGAYDAVVAANVLHLVPDLDRALDALVRVLRPGGRLVVPTYLHDATALSRAVSAAMGLAGFPGHRRFTLDGLTAAVSGRGLQIVASAQIEGLLPIGFVAADTGPDGRSS